MSKLLLLIRHLPPPNYVTTRWCGVTSDWNPGDLPDLWDWKRQDQHLETPLFGVLARTMKPSPKKGGSDPAIPKPNLDLTQGVLQLLLGRCKSSFWQSKNQGFFRRTEQKEFTWWFNSHGDSQQDLSPGTWGIQSTQMDDVRWCKRTNWNGDSNIAWHVWSEMGWHVRSEMADEKRTCSTDQRIMEGPSWVDSKVVMIYTLWKLM